MPLGSLVGRELGRVHPAFTCGFIEEQVSYVRSPLRALANQQRVSASRRRQSGATVPETLAGFRRAHTPPRADPGAQSAPSVVSD